MPVNCEGNDVTDDDNGIMDELLGEQPKVRRKKTAGGRLTKLSRISVPVAVAGREGYVIRHISFKVDADLGRGLERIRLGLVDQKAELANGRRVQSVHDAAKWMVEQTLLLKE